MCFCALVIFMDYLQWNVCPTPQTQLGNPSWGTWVHKYVFEQYKVFQHIT